MTASRRDADLQRTPERAFEDEDINPEIVQAIDDIHNRDLEPERLKKLADESAKKQKMRVRVIGFLLAIAAFAVWYF
ncbi:MAG: hypothetical protein CTY31_08170 [Hyphomicrobium sp.]|nr:MAG: hypothetical protein CTY39_01330 [Hyphomicrobium sp.]PPC99858.1 MAG: hypothetical protein CTY31_08170 [Hyphomicrobium sp.]